MPDLKILTLHLPELTRVMGDSGEYTVARIDAVLESAVDAPFEPFTVSVTTLLSASDPQLPLLHHEQRADAAAADALEAIAAALRKRANG